MRAGSGNSLGGCSRRAFSQPAITSHGTAKGAATSVFRLLLLLFLAAPSSSWANRSSEFEAANKLYEEGKFAQAATAYEKLCQNGSGSAPLFFNLGNAFYKNGQIGRAIGAYRQGQALAPRDPDIRANLQFARKTVAAPTLPTSRVNQWLGKMTLNEWTLVTAAVLWLFILILILGQWRPGLQTSLRFYTISAAAVLVFCGVCTAIAFHDSHSVRVAIVIAHDVPARQGPFDESQTAVTLQDGAELKVLDRKDQWLQVSDGRRILGWLRQDQALVTSGACRS